MRTDLNIAIRNMRAFHHGQVDKSGLPYHLHPHRVMLRLGKSSTNDEQVAALFHDVVEDTALTIADLRNFGYSESALVMIDLLTKHESLSHRQYLQRIIDSGNVGAMRVKLADLYDNSWEKRVEDAPASIKTGLKKMIVERYHPSIMLLREVLGFAAAGIVEGDI